MRSDVYSLIIFQISLFHPVVVMESRLLLAATLVTLLSTDFTSCSKVLVVPFNHKSHISLFGGFGNALLEDGHEVWILSIEKFRKSIEKKKLVPLLFHLPPEYDIGFKLEKFMEKNPTGEGLLEGVEQDMHIEFGRYCDEALGNKNIMNVIKNQKFDLVVMDGTMAFTCMYTIPYKYDIPFITVHGIQTVSWTAGVTGMPSIEPDIMLEVSNKMDFWQRLANLKIWWTVLNDPINEIHDQHFLQTYAPEKPWKSISAIQRDSEMFLLNYELLCLDYPRVSAPNYQFLGPGTAGVVKPLDKDLEEFVQGADHGVVVMTVGTFTAWQFTWRVMREKMFKAFGRLNQRVIVQYALDEDPGSVPENVLLLKWVPQNDLLGHPKTVLFVTHGGNNGQNEAIFHGVPMLVVPIAIDQRSAGVRMRAHSYGDYVNDLGKITSDELYDMMHEIISNDTYKTNIKKCSRIVRSMPSAHERFVFWVNHILEFGGKHLRPPSLDMPFYQVYMLDIIAFYLFIGLAAFHGTLVVLYLAYRYLTKGGKTKKD